MCHVIRCVGCLAPFGPYEPHLGAVEEHDSAEGVDGGVAPPLVEEPARLIQILEVLLIRLRHTKNLACKLHTGTMMPPIKRIACSGGLSLELLAGCAASVISQSICFNTYKLRRKELLRSCLQRQPLSHPCTDFELHTLTKSMPLAGQKS